MMEKLNRNTADLSNGKGRTIYISYGEISGRPGKISIKGKKILHNNAAAAATQYFNTNTVIQ